MGSTGSDALSDPTIGHGLAYLFAPSGAPREPDFATLEPAAPVTLIGEREAKR